MANNIDVKNASGVDTTVKTTDNSGVHTPHQNIDSLPGTVASDITAIKTAVEILDNTVSGSELRVDVAEKTILFATGTASTSGDNTLIAAQGSGIRIVISSLVVQNESSTATTMIVKNGATAIARVRGQNQGDGLALTFASGREWKLTANTALVLNLSGANSCGYSVSYYTE